MQAQIDSIQNDLGRFQAPNLKANARLGNVEQRLRSTEAEFEETRRKARKARAQFEKIRRLRCNAFMKCFISIADNIDPLYKSISRNPGAQVRHTPSLMRSYYHVYLHKFSEWGERIECPPRPPGFLINSPPALRCAGVAERSALESKHRV